jgi:deoxyribodipyrimidine photolyase-related protein
MCEVKQEATYVQHHKKKIVFVFSAMRHFAQKLRSAGFNVQYVTYNDPQNTGSLLGEVRRLLENNTISHVVLSEFETWSALLGVPVELRVDDRFLSTPAEFSD